MIISWSTSITDAHMRKLDCSLEDFMDIFKPEHVQEQPTKDGRNYIAGQLLDYTKPRGKGNVINRCAVVLDCDDANTKSIKALCEGVRQLGVRSVVHSTYSSTPDKPRVRVVIPLTTVVVPGDYVSLCKALMNHLNMVKWDESCAQAERAMYMPAKPEGGDYWAEHTDGPLMDGVEWLKAHGGTKERKARTSKGNIAKRDHRRKPENDPGIQGAFNRVYTIEDAIEEFDLPYEPCRDDRWTYYSSHTQGGLRLVEGREDLCISEHTNTDPACFVDGNGSVRALSAFELCAVHLYGEDDDTTVAPRERASMQKMAKRAAEDERVRAELGSNNTKAADVTWLANHIGDTYTQAEYTAAALRDRLAYVDGVGVLMYTPPCGLWEPAHESVALNCIADVIRTWYQGALLTGDNDLIKKVSKLRHVSGPRAIAAHLPAMLSIPADAFDANPELLCTPNGVVNLRTGKLMPHDPKYLMTKRTNAPYTPGATHPAWDKALKALDATERVWLQRWVGCALTGYQPDDNGAATPILLGGGSNGKSVLMTSIARAFGGYAHMGTHALLTPDNGKDLLRAAASLRGVRLCYIEELPDGVLNGNAIKQVSATPTMKGEFKFKPEFTFNATHSLMVSANVAPRLDECTDAVVRRLAVLPFNYRYVPNPSRKGDRLVDSGLLRELETKEAQAAILAWAVEGARAYLADGRHVLPATELMEGEKSKWLSNVDTLSGFFNDMLIEDAGAMIPWTHLYAAFTEWQRENGGKTWNKATFKNRVSSHRMFSGFKSGKLRTTGMSCYRDKFDGGPSVPTGTQVAGLRGLRFRTPADDDVLEDELKTPVSEFVEPTPVVVADPEALIQAEDIPAPTPHVVPEKEEVERRGLIEEIDGLACFVQQLPGGHEEVTRLAYETGAVNRGAPLGKLRAFKMRLEGALVRLTVAHHEEPDTPLAGDSHTRRQE